MKAILLVRLLNHTFSERPGDSGTEFCLLQENGERIAGKAQTIAELDCALAGFQISSTALVVPGEDVLLTSGKVASRKIKQIQLAIPNVIEEDLIADIDQSHISILHIEGDEVEVAVVDHRKMRYWIEEVEKLGLALDHVIPEHLLVPYVNGKSAVLYDQEENKSLFRTGAFAGFVCPINSTALFLEVCLNKDRKNSTPESFLHLNASGKPLGNDKAPDSYENSEKSVSLLLFDAFIKLSPDERQHLNLRKGAYSPKSGDRKIIFTWPRLMATAFLLALAHIFMNLATGSYLAGMADEARENSFSLYQELFPQDTRLVNIRTQLENHLRESSAPVPRSSFLPFLAIVSESLDPAMELQYLRYDEDMGALSMSLKADSIAQFNYFQATLAQEGLKVLIDSVNQEELKVNGHITVSFAESAPGRLQ